jgi:methyl-accepting chemotaxis protein
MGKNLRITTALSTVLAVFVLLFAAAGAGAVAVLRDNRAWIAELGRANIERASDLNDVSSALFQARSELTDAKTYMEGGRAEDRDHSLAAAQALLAQATTAFKRLRASPETDAQGKPLYDAVLTAYTALTDQCLALMPKAIQGWNGPEVNRLSDKVLPVAATAFVKAVGAFQNHTRQRGANAVSSVEETQNFAISAAIALALFVLALAIGVRVLFQRSMLRPLGEAGRHFDRMADGDLTLPLADHGTNEVGVLFSSMRRMQGGLSDAVTTVRAGVEEIHDGVLGIAAGGAEMSDRTAGQASSLQETAASMDVLADRVRATSDNATLASRRSDTATQLARRGGEAVQEVVSTMQGISLSSKRIAEIVGVVDSIAFQTNILALNAAVEAARAGNQGKGFAVVAAEVRGLAQRSGSAAREIKELIEESTTRVDAGVRQVSVAGDTMREMLEAVSQVSSIVNEISVASAEQAAGIQAVNTAVAEVDRATQENAAMAEETAAAAAALEVQGQRLRDAVAVFKVATHIDEQPALRARDPVIKPERQPELTLFGPVNA